MNRIAVLMTCYNRKEKTLRCLSTLQEGWEQSESKLSVTVFLTDDGCSDGTADAIRSQGYHFPIHILQGTGNLFWNGGMINSWKAALAEGGFDGYLWLNDDVIILPSFWEDLITTDDYCLVTYGKNGIYIGSTKDADTGAYTYGGFNYINKLTLKDQILPPNGFVQPCEAGHGNITYVADNVVGRMGIFCDKYIHGGTDHDYTYLAHKAGFPVLILPHFAASCRNDHTIDGGRKNFFKMSLCDRLRYLKSPRGLNLHNALLFSRRCFPWRYPIILVTGYLKAFFPKAYYRLYLRARGVKHASWMKEPSN